MTGEAAFAGRPDAAAPQAPVGLLAELTHRCPLQCPYCSNPLALEGARDELPTERWLDVLDQAADLGILQLHLSGGEPAARRDLEAIVERATARDIYSNLITSGIGLNQARLEGLAAKGLDHVQLSIQDAEEASCNRIAGYSGAYARKLVVARIVRELGLPLTINAPIHRQNIDGLEAIIQLAVDLGARRLETAHVQYYGWAFANRAALMPSRAQVMRSLAIVEEARTRLRGLLTIDFVAPDYYASRPKPCMGGWGRGIMNVTPSGKVLPCHAAETIPELTFDNVTQRALADIWLNSEAFNAFRGTQWMAEPCRSCEHRFTDWGGCRCQALALTGRAANTDPACNKSALHADLVAVAETEAAAPAPAFTYRRAPSWRNAASRQTPTTAQG